MRPTFRPSTLTLFLAIVLLIPAATAYTPTVSVTDSGASTSNYERFHVISASYDFILTTASPIEGGDIHVGGTSHLVNFTHDALTSATNPNQNFSLAAETNSMTMKLNAITVDHVEVVTTDTKAEKTSFGYIMPSTLTALTVPQTVLYTQSGTTQVIQQSSYFTSAPSFAGCAAPCVFQDTANRTLIVSAPATSGGYTLDFYFPVYTAGGSSVVGGGTPPTSGGGPTAPVTPPSTSGNSTTPSSTTGSIVQIAVIAVVVVVVIALVLGRASEGPFRKPKSSKSNPRGPKSGSPNWNRGV